MRSFLLVLVCLATAPAFAAPGGKSVSSTKDERAIGITLNFPHIYTLSYEGLHRGSYWSWGVGAGFLPTVTFPSATTQVGLSMLSADIRGRYHPFAGGFFLGLGIGYANTTASGTQNIDVAGTAVPTLVEVNLKNMFLLPHLGWLWTPGGMMIGLEFGAAVGFGGNSNVNMTITDPNLQSFNASVQGTTAYQNLRTNVQDGFNKFGNSSMTYVAIRLGFTF